MFAFGADARERVFRIRTVSRARKLIRLGLSTERKQTPHIVEKPRTGWNHWREFGLLVGRRSQTVVASY